MLGAMTFAAKWVMAALPNIEPVSLMVMLFGVVFGKKALYPVYLYVMLEILFYGLGTWNVNQSYWAIFIGEEYATTGADGIVLTDGGIYSLVYTIG